MEALIPMQPRPVAGSQERQIGGAATVEDGRAHAGKEYVRDPSEKSAADTNTHTGPESTRSVSPFS